MWRTPPRNVQRLVRKQITQCWAAPLRRSVLTARAESRVLPGINSTEAIRAPPPRGHGVPSAVRAGSRGSPGATSTASAPDRPVPVRAEDHSHLAAIKGRSKADRSAPASRTSPPRSTRVGPKTAVWTSRRWAGVARSSSASPARPPSSPFRPEAARTRAQVGRLSMSVSPDPPPGHHRGRQVLHLAARRAAFRPIGGLAPRVPQPVHGRSRRRWAERGSLRAERCSPLGKGVRGAGPKIERGPTP
jgi:hypothetical protein